MILVYVSPVPWRSFSQRSHFMALWLLRRPEVESVIWVDPYPTRLPNFQDFRHLRIDKLDLQEGDTPSGLEVLSPPWLPIEPLWFSSSVLKFLWVGWMKALERKIADKKIKILVGKPSHLTNFLIDKLPTSPVLVDVLDNFPEFYRGLSRLAMQKNLKHILSRANSVIFSASNSIDLIPSSIPDNNYELVRNATIVEPLDNRKAKSQKRSLVIGYVGSIAKWFDWGLVYKIAKAIPKSEIRIVGPVHNPPPGKAPSNVFLMGPKSIAQIVDILPGFDVGLIPFKLTNLTKYVDPVKYYDYRAAGLSVLATNFGEIPYHKENDTKLLAIGVDGSLPSENELRQVAALKDEFKSPTWEDRFNSSRILRAFLVDT